MKVYFDNAATTPLHQKVFEKMKQIYTEDFGNPSSIHSFGRKARVALEEAREVAANFINANPSEIYFTSGGTEASNFAIRGIAQSAFQENKKKKIITSKVEHHATLDSFNYLCNNGFISKYIESTADTSINLNSFNEILDDSTALLSLIHINNETGSVNPIEEVSSIIKGKEIYFHADAVQGFGKVQIDVQKLGVHSLSASAHKINGPKAIGLCYVKSGTPISPLILGGSQERNRRGGTENVAAIAGFAEAIKIADEKMVSNFDHVLKLRNEFIKGINSFAHDKIKINGGANASPFILSITFLSEYFKNDSEAMIIYLDINGIAASNGSACNSGTLKPSHVILNAGYLPQDAAGTIRFSFGLQNTMEEVEYTLGIIKKMAEKFGR